MPPVEGRLLLLYVSTTEDSVGAVLAQHDDEKRERAVYYLSKLLNDAERRYTTMEKNCAAVVWVAKKWKNDFRAHEVKLIARMDQVPLRQACPYWSLGPMAKFLKSVLHHLCGPESHKGLCHSRTPSPSSSASLRTCAFGVSR